jgi:hypothetical protein
MAEPACAPSRETRSGTRVGVAGLYKDPRAPPTPSSPPAPGPGPGPLFVPHPLPSCSLCVFGYLSTLHHRVFQAEELILFIICEPTRIDPVICTSPKHGPSPSKRVGLCSKYSEFADMEKFHTGAGREIITSRPPCLVRRMCNGGPCNSGPHRRGRAMASAGHDLMRRVH